VLNNRVHQQAPVAGEQGAILVRHQIEQLAIAGFGRSEHIDAEQAEVTGQGHEMAIGNKPLDSGRLQVITRIICWCNANGINLYVDIITNNGGKICRCAVAQNNVHLRVWDAAGFDDVFHPRFFAELLLDNGSAITFPDE
jgi:hypothetical protein